MFYKLSVCVVTYNQVKYIKTTLDSLLMQKTDFPFQILISDDASTDGTSKIIRDYSKRFPYIIKAFFNKENIGPFRNSLSLYKRANTKYVSICNGDDYLIDPLKYQKQVDYLDMNPNCSICFHPVRVIWENHTNKSYIYPSKKFQTKSIYSLDELLKFNFIQTNSVMYRWMFNKFRFFDFYKSEIAPGDYFLNLLHAKYGDIGFLEDVMAVYRRNSSGIWSDAECSARWFYCCGIPSIRFLLEVQKLFSIDNSAKIRELATLTEISIKGTNDSNKFKELHELIPNVCVKPNYVKLRYLSLIMVKPFTYGKLRLFLKQKISFFKKVAAIQKHM